MPLYPRAFGNRIPTLQPAPVLRLRGAGRLPCRPFSRSETGSCSTDGGGRRFRPGEIRDPNGATRNRWRDKTISASSHGLNKSRLLWDCLSAPERIFRIAPLMLLSVSRKTSLPQILSTIWS